MSDAPIQVLRVNRAIPCLGIQEGDRLVFDDETGMVMLGRYLPTAVVRAALGIEDLASGPGSGTTAPVGRPKLELIR